MRDLRRLTIIVIVIAGLCAGAVGAWRVMSEAGGTGTGTESGTGTGTGAGAGTGTGTESGAGTETGTGSGAGTGTGSGAGTETAAGGETETETGTASETASGSETGAATAAGGETGSDALADAGPSRLGSLSPRAIQAEVRENLPYFRFCFEWELARHPELEGRVTLEFHIAEDGTVSEARVVDDELQNETVARCFQGVTSRMEFPPPSGGPVSVRYPLSLSGAPPARRPAGI